MTGKCSRINASQCLWRTLVVTTFVACVALVYVFLTFEDGYNLQKVFKSLVRAERLTNENCINVCNTKECILHANSLLNNMNPSIDPCIDFYVFSCGKLGDRFGEDDTYSYGKRNTIEMFAKAKDILDNIDPVPGSAFDKMKIVYDSCTNPGYEVDAVPTALKFLEGIGIPDWPNLANNFSFSDSGLAYLLGSLIAHNERSIVRVMNERLDKTENTVNATITMPYTQKFDESTEILVHRMLKYFDLKSETSEEIWGSINAVQDAILNLEKDSRTFAEEETTRGISVDCSQAGETEWGFACDILNTYLDISNISRTYKRHAFIPVTKVYFFRNIIPTFRNVSSKSIAHYVALQFFLDHMQDLSFYFRLKNTKNNTPRTRRKLIMEQEYCIKWIMIKLQQALGYQYILKVLSQEGLQEVQDIINETIKESIVYISNQVGISNDFKEKMINMLSNIPTTIQDVKKSLNETYINHYYEEFHPTEDNFFLNVLRYGKHIKFQILSGIFKARDDPDQYMNLFTVNAEARIEIDVGLGLLLPTIFSSGLHKSVNLVSFGQIMAHELAHRFQDGVSFLFNPDDTTRQNFVKRWYCYRNQFSHFKYDLINANVSTRTVDEDMADGLSILFIDKMIKKYRSSTEFLLPSLPYSEEQLLYISSLQMYCEKMNKEGQEFFSKFGHHSISRFRLQAMMQNSKGFSSAFNCPNGTFMNPVKKCAFFD